MQQLPDHKWVQAPIIVHDIVGEGCNGCMFRNLSFKCSQIPCGPNFHGGRHVVAVPLDHLGFNK